MAALLGSMLLDRTTPVAGAEVEAANDAVGQLLQGADLQLAVESSRASSDVLAAMLELYARAVRGEGKIELARDLRELVAVLLE